VNLLPPLTPSLGGFWDFTADLTFKDTAYTNESLGAHTDNTYFTDPARLQLFHLLSHTDGSGGENTLVDGFAAAAQLRAENPAHYDQLVKHRHPWHASGNEDSCIQPSAQAPVFAIHPDFGKMYQIRWNNYDRAPKTNWTAQEQESWYSAARHYNKILQSKEIKQTLQPGSALSEYRVIIFMYFLLTDIVLVFDNWRMLHGRTEFTGKRRMCGGYGMYCSFSLDLCHPLMNGFSQQ
jgi:trimethyllysine dioxygenase